MVNFKQYLAIILVSISLFIQLQPAKAETKAGNKEPVPCDAYSDNFDIYNLERWSDVLLYSKSQGIVTVEDGQLVLGAPGPDTNEIQVYSLFTFKGDFDIQIDYEVLKPEKIKLCRFNTGMVLQTLDDEVSYKCYIAQKPLKKLIFRARLDKFGEKNLEKRQLKKAPYSGTIRLIRKKDIISFLALKKDQWTDVYVFHHPCKDKLRVRLKLQTGENEIKKDACSVFIRFDNFKVNSCDTVIEE